MEKTLSEQVKVGSIIICKGMRIKVKEIAYQDFYVIEFTDTKGIYRSWKPEVDGGYIESEVM